MTRHGPLFLLAAGPALAPSNSSGEARSWETLEVNDRGTPVAASSVWKFALTKGIGGTATGFARWYAGLPLDDPRRIGPEHFRQGL